MDIFGLSTLIRPFFSSVFIGINIDSKVCSFKVLRTKNGSILENVNKEFKTINNELPMDAIKFIRSYQKKYPFTYLSIMSKTYNQGILKKEPHQDYSQYGIEPKEALILDFGNWQTYIKKSALNENLEKFSKLEGIDYLFSPFIVIYSKIKEHLQAKTTLYMLQERGGLSLMIADSDGVYFGGYFMVEGEAEDVSDEENNADSIDDMLVSDFPIMEENFELSDDIDELEDLGDSDLFIDKLNEKLLSTNQNEEQTKEKIDDIVKTSFVLNIIQNSLREFYSNELYESKFIEQIIILDAYGISDGALDYLSENMMIDTYKISTNIVDELCKLSKTQFEKGRL